MKKHLIIARYNEDIEWVKYIDNNLYDIYIYIYTIKVTKFK